MKKLLFIAGWTLAFAFIFATSVHANAGPHGGYGLFTDACAGCHRAHTAVSTDLLVETSAYELCMACHGPAGPAFTNVYDGTYRGETGSRLNGGGVVNVGGTAPVTSLHDVNGLNGSNGVGRAWGSDGGDAMGVEGVLECSSCHNPHGSNNYRILRDGNPSVTSATTESKWVANNPYLLEWSDLGMTPDGSPGSVLAGQSYTVLEATTPVGNGPNTYVKDQGNYTMGIVRFCSTCHKQYWTMSGSAGYASSDPAYYLFPGQQTWAGDTAGAIYRYRHATSITFNAPTSNALRFSIAAWTDPQGSTRIGFNCLTCHFAHGTSATMSGFAAGSAGPIPAGDSSLLYYPERGTCRSCHQTTR